MKNSVEERRNPGSVLARGVTESMRDPCKVRVLVSLSLPIEYLLPLEECVLTTKQLNVRKKLASSSLAIKKTFLDATATLSLVTILRETMIKCHCSATQGLLATDLVFLSGPSDEDDTCAGTPPLLTTTPAGGRLSSRQIRTHDIPAMSLLP
ncbi:hypothetical protein TNCV_3267551 [Trichonephila clavipes]|nr:hypothetical protein TNCV_3267551 [Trichonephila clavipes]